MSLTLLAPVSLVEAVGQLARQRARLPGLEALCMRGSLELSDRSLDDVAGALFGVTAPSPVPIGPLRLASEDRSPVGKHAAGKHSSSDERYWLCADPIATTLLIGDVQIASRVTDLTHDEADALAGTLAPALADDGLRLIAPHPSRWYVESASPLRASTPLWRSIGRSMREALPPGADGAAWRRRLNEAQMTLHAHPDNVARDARAATRVGSIWFWGGGRWPEFAAGEIDRANGGPSWMRAACAANGIAFDPALPELAAWLRAASSASDRRLCVLIDDWDSARDVTTALVDLDRQWFAPLAGALDAQRTADLTLWFADERGALALRCANAGASRRPDWRRWLGISARKNAPTLEESLRAIEP
jgi:hypothetical protein